MGGEALKNKSRPLILNADGNEMIYYPTNLPITVESFNAQRLKDYVGTKVSTLNAIRFRQETGKSPSEWRRENACGCGTGVRYGIIRGMRTAKIERNTKETRIRLELNLDGSGEGTVDTGIGFFNHMLELLKKHALVDLTVKADGDIDVDYHHTVEDVGLVFGQALDQALGDRKGLTRYGFASIPMDEALCETSLDLGGRPFLVMQCAMKHMMVKDFEVKLVEEFFRAVSVESRSNIHLRQVYGDEAHHVCEGLFKSYARALRAAVKIDPNEKGVPSSKGLI